eukprot:scaffold86769_cov50-Phaeocystis_antarctica.AAC.7
MHVHVHARAHVPYTCLPARIEEVGAVRGAEPCRELRQRELRLAAAARAAAGAAAGAAAEAASLG